MGTVGINFGSATSGAGFDVSSTVSAIVANLKAVETPWQDQLTSLKAEDTAITSIGSDLSALSTSLQALTDFQGVMASKLGQVRTLICCHSAPPAQPPLRAATRSSSRDWRRPRRITPTRSPARTL